MNPSYMAFVKALQTSMFNPLVGKTHVPKKDQFNQTNEFPRSDLIEMAEAEQKERKVRAHLDKLAKEAKARSENS